MKVQLAWWDYCSLFISRERDKGYSSLCACIEKATWGPNQEEGSHREPDCAGTLTLAQAPDSETRIAVVHLTTLQHSVMAPEVSGQFKRITEQRAGKEAKIQHDLCRKGLSDWMKSMAGRLNVTQVLKPPYFYPAYHTKECFDLLCVFQVGRDALTAQALVHGRKKLDFWGRPIPASQLCFFLTMKTWASFLAPKPQFPQLKMGLRVGLGQH